MAITASKLRENVYRILDEVAETGVPVEIVRKGVTLRIVADVKRSKLANLKKRKDWLGSEEELTKSFWLESDEYKEWLEKWDKFKIVHLDTNVLIWLYEGSVQRLGKTARRAIEKLSPVASAAAGYELEVLYELGRRASHAKKLIDALANQIGLEICNLPFRTIVDQALAECWTREPWDRLIVANAKAARAPLVTADKTILRHYSRAIWD
jgi:PIN domain nuclease of toxin-antitoxin system